MNRRARDENPAEPGPVESCSSRETLRRFTREDIETLCHSLRSWIHRTGLDLPAHLTEDLVQEALVHLWNQGRPRPRAEGAPPAPERP